MNRSNDLYGISYVYMILVNNIIDQEQATNSISQKSY